MAKIKSGILGGYRGTIKDVVGYKRLGSDIIQTRSKRAGDSITGEVLSNANFLRDYKNTLYYFRAGLTQVKNRYPNLWEINYQEILLHSINEWASNEPKYDLTLFVNTGSNLLSSVEFESSVVINNRPRIVLRNLSQLKIQYPDLLIKSIYYRQTPAATFITNTAINGNAMHIDYPYVFNPPGPRYSIGAVFLSSAAQAINGSLWIHARSDV